MRDLEGAQDLREDPDGLLNAIWKNRHSRAASRLDEQRVRVVDVDFGTEQRGPRVKQGSLAARQAHHDQLRFTDLEARAAQHVVGPVRLVEDHAGDRTVHGIDDRDGEDPNVSLVEQPGQA